MYRYLVLCLVGGAMLIGAYYVREAGIEKVFSYVPSNGDEALTPQDVAGKYLCTKSFGCKESYQMTLYLNAEAKLVKKSVSSSTLPHIERGTWSFIDGGFITVKLLEEGDTSNEDTFDTDQASVTFDEPEMFVIQSVTKNILTKIVYNTKKYTTMSKPKFVKQEI